MNKVATNLQVLVGLPLWGYNTAAATVTLQFGEHRQVFSQRTGLREVGEFSLHIQCAHYFNKNGRTVTNPREVLRNEGPWNVRTVTSLTPDEIIVELSHQIILRIQADVHAASEQWRLLKVGSSEPHLVFEDGRLFRE